MNIASVLAIVGLAVFAAGCASTSGDQKAAGGSPANVSGWWRGGTVGAGATSVTMQLAQTGSALTGVIDVAGRADVSGPLTGTVEGDSVRFTLTSGYGSTGLLNVNGDTITGVVGGNGVRLQRAQ
jgi:hypothetical protein